MQSNTLWIIKQNSSEFDKIPSCGFPKATFLHLFIPEKRDGNDSYPNQWKKHFKKLHHYRPWNWVSIPYLKVYMHFFFCIISHLKKKKIQSTINIKKLFWMFIIIIKKKTFKKNALLYSETERSFLISKYNFFALYVISRKKFQSTINIKNLFWCL